MRGIYLMFFTILVKDCSAYVLLPEVLETAIQNIRSRREASCGGVVDVSNGPGEIQLPTETFNGTELYRVNEDCKWTVKTSPDHFMILKSEYFSLEESDNCIWDYVEIKEIGKSGTTSRYCGWDPLTFITATDEIELQFKSDISYEDNGFKFIVESRKKNDDASQCDSSITGGVNSRITNYDAEGKDCFYRITAPGDKVIELNLKMHKFASPSCEEESIVVYEGLSNQGIPLETICSSTVADRIRPYHVSTLFIEYKNPQQQEGERFTIYYSFVEDTFTPAPIPPTTPSPVGGQNDCSRFYKDIETDTGDLIYTVPEYENNKECTIVVRNTLLPSHVVQIQFLYFEIEDSNNCTFDSLKIMSGEREDSAMLGGPYCGESLHGRTFRTSGNSLRLEFKTDVSFALKGFEARISFVPSEECECDKNQICIRQDYEKKCIRGQQCTACKNGGTCIITGSTQTCYCAAGFQGDNCSTQTGETSTHHLTFTVAPKDRTLKRDEGHTEECAVKVKPGEEVQYYWTFNGVLIEDYSQKSGFGSHHGGVLQIDEFTDTLEGQYSCFATTSSGTAEHTFEYRIVENCNVRIYPGPKSESKKINENALMMCRVDSRAKEVRWKKNGVYINFDRNERYKQMVNNYLQIKNIGMEDAGTYRCEAEDNYGCSSYKEGTLTVIDVKRLNTYCGISVHDEFVSASSRISKGSYAKPNDNPWHVIFRSRGDSQRHMAFCGGTLISQTYILTAAHCIEEFEQNENIKAPLTPRNVLFLLGTTSCLGTGKMTNRTFKSFTVHPNFGDRSKYDNDIALIELDSAVEYTDAIRPICIEPSVYNDRVFLEKSGNSYPISGKVAGCGKKRQKTDVQPSFLQEVQLPYVDRDECEESLGDQSFQFTDMMICAGSNIERMGDTCGGDSGGALVMTTSAQWVQTGIVSWGIGCDVKKYYGYYTDVGKFYDWIEGITKFSEEEVPDFF